MAGSEAGWRSWTLQKWNESRDCLWIGAEVLVGFSDKQCARRPDSSANATPPERDLTMPTKAKEEEAVNE